MSTKNISKRETHIYLLFHHFLALRRTLLLVSIKFGVGRIRNINRYEYLFGQKRINAENINSFIYILILLLFLFIITYEFRRTFLGVGRGQNWFLKNVFSVLLNKRKKRYFQADRSSKSRLFEQAQYRNENDTHNPIKIIDITDNQINGRLDND